jgi:uncharacterized protein HemY
MANILMLVLSLVVVLATGGVLFWFFRRLNRIEEELWGKKRREASETAHAMTREKLNAENEEDETES